MKKTIVCLIGPTAVGKTEVALALARKINAEIICCDSMQVYQGIDIATAKPSKRQRRVVPHHLIDILRPSQEYNAERFRRSAEKIIREIHHRGRVPLIVGGTGLYLQALLDGLFPGPGQSLKLRRQYYQQAQRYGAVYLYKKLQRLDPFSAQSIHRHDLRRIVRALEVCVQSGLCMSALKKKTRGIRDKFAVLMFGLSRPREELYVRIEKRVEWMFRRGLVAEIKGLVKLRLSKTAKSLLGYKEITGFLQGEYSKAEAIRLLKRNTRRYAKRQLCWFRREKGTSWIGVGERGSPQSTAREIHSRCTRSRDIRKRR